MGPGWPGTTPTGGRVSEELVCIRDVVGVYWWVVGLYWGCNPSLNPPGIPEAITWLGDSPVGCKRTVLINAR